MFLRDNIRFGSQVGKASDCKSLMRWFKSNPNLSFNNKLIMYVADTLGRKPLHNEVMPIRKYPLWEGRIGGR